MKKARRNHKIPVGRLESALLTEMGMEGFENPSHRACFVLWERPGRGAESPRNLTIAAAPVEPVFRRVKRAEMGAGW